MRQGLAERQRGLGLPGGLDRGHERAGAVAGGVPVPGHPAGGEAGVAGQRGVGLERLGHPAVHPAGLAGQQALGDRLLEQGVPELVAGGVGRRDQDVLLDGRPQRRRRAVSPTTSATASRSAWGMVRPITAPVRSTCRVAGASASSRASSRSRTVGGSSPAPVEREQLLGEERVALGAGVDLVEERAGRGYAEDVADLVGLLVAGQRLEHDVVVARGGPARRSAGPRRGRCGASSVRRVRTQQDAAAQLVREQRQQLAGGPVGPVEVLDHQHQRALGG